MHDTLFPYVKGDINVYCDNKIEGWLFYIYKETYEEVWELRVIEVFEDNVFKVIDDGSLIQVERPDVSDFYKNRLFINSGFIFNNYDITKKNIKIQMLINNVWENIFEFPKSNNFIPSINRTDLSIIVVDNFYKEPDLVREFALKQQFNEHKEYHKGRRTEEGLQSEGLKEAFEYYMNKKITNWSTYRMNGCFQLCMAGEQLVYHYDLQSYAAIIFLTPEAPPETGTSTYKSKATGDFKITPNSNTNLVFKNGFYDSTQFDLVDKIGNMYNRLVIFDAKLIHSASCYFGNNDHNCRLFQMFFFDIEN